MICNGVVKILDNTFQLVTELKRLQGENDNLVGKHRWTCVYS